MKWSEIKARDRAKYIRLKVSEGYTSLDDIINSFATGGSMDWETGYHDGDTANTTQCALFLNEILRNNGYLISGDAWDLNDVDVVFNGYDTSLKPKEYSKAAVTDYNRAATKNIWDNFDSKTLDKNKPYVVNMYYKGSPHLEEVYNFNGDVMGTHTGILSFEDGKWWVTHNIGSHIHREPFISLLNPNGNWGVTTIYAPRENTLFNKARHYLGFAGGGSMDNDTNWKSTPTVPWASYYDNINLDSNNDGTDWIEPGSEPHLDLYGNKVYTGAVSGLDIIPDSENPNIFYRTDGLTLERTGAKPLDELTVTPANGNIDEYGNIFDANGNLIKEANMLTSNNENWLQRNITRPVLDYFREFKYDINNNNVIGGKYTLPAIGAAALLGSDTALGAANWAIDKATVPVYNLITKNPITTKTAGAALESLFLGDVIDRRLVNGENPTYGLGNNIFDSYVLPGLLDVMDASILFSGASKVPGIVLRVGPSVVNAGKTAYNYARNWRPFVPWNPNRYYRIVGETGNPIGDAIESGVIRGPGAVPGYREALKADLDAGPNTITLLPKAHDYPMFAKGKPWSGSTARRDFGKPTIIRSKSDTGPIVWEESNKDFRHKGHAGIFRPSYNGDVNASPIEYFEYWEPRKFGYMRKDFTAPKSAWFPKKYSK